MNIWSHLPSPVQFTTWWHTLGAAVERVNFTKQIQPSPFYLEITATLLITLTLSLSCFQGVKNFTECPVHIEQVCSKLANCKSCSLNLNCQWEQNHSQCHSLPGKPDSGAWRPIMHAWDADQMFFFFFTCIWVEDVDLIGNSEQIWWYSLLKPILKQIHYEFGCQGLAHGTKLNVLSECFKHSRGCFFFSSSGFLGTCFSICHPDVVYQLCQRI